MSSIGQPERATQDRVIALFRTNWTIAMPATGLTATATATSKSICSRHG